METNLMKVHIFYTHTHVYNIVNKVQYEGA